MNSPFTDLEFRLVHAPAAAGAADITDCTVIDMQNREAVAFLVDFGTITAGAATSIKVQQSSDNGVGDAFDDLAGSKVTVLDTDDNHGAMVQVIKPLKRWVKLIISRATQNSVVNSAWAVVAGARNLPTSQATASVIAASKTLVSPEEGTA